MMVEQRSAGSLTLLNVVVFLRAAGMNEDHIVQKHQGLALLWRTVLEA